MRNFHFSILRVCVALGVLTLGYASADEISRLRSATVLSLPYSKDGHINEAVRSEIFDALTAIQEAHEDVRFAEAKIWYDLNTLVIFPADEEISRLKNSPDIAYQREGKTYLRSTGIDQLDKLNDAFHVESVELWNIGWLLLKFESPLNTQEVEKLYNNVPGIKHAVKNEHDAPRHSSISLKEDGDEWKFTFDIPCKREPSECGHGAYTYRNISYDREMKQVTRTEDEDLLSILKCSNAAISVIKEYDLDFVQTCGEELFELDKKNVYFVRIEYGAGMDCPSGCIFSYLSAIVDSGGMFPYGFYFASDDDSALSLETSSSDSYTGDKLTGRNHPIVETQAFRELVGTLR